MTLDLILGGLVTAGLLAWVQRTAVWRPLYQDANSSAWVRTP